MTETEQISERGDYILKSIDRLRIMSNEASLEEIEGLINEALRFEDQTGYQSHAEDIREGIAEKTQLNPEIVDSLFNLDPEELRTLAEADIDGKEELALKAKFYQNHAKTRE